jgi:Cu+-exporting ATPase
MHYPDAVRGEGTMVSKVLDMFRRGGSTATDPVCGMQVDTSNPPGGSYEYKGTTYYFCGRGCRLEFEEDPEGYLSGEKSMQM